MQKQSDLPSNIIIIDINYLDFAAGDMRNYFSSRTGHPINKMNYDSLIIPLVVEAFPDQRKEDRLIINIYDKESAILSNITPDNPAKELNNASADTPLGTIHFMAATAEDMVSRKDFFVEIATQAAMAENVKQIVIIPYGNEYDNEINALIGQYPAKEFTRFDIVKRENEKGIHCQTLVYPIMQALGIEASEL